MFEQMEETNLVTALGLLLVAAELFLGVQTGFDFVLVGSILVVGGLIGNLFGSLTLTLILTVILSVIYILFGRRTIRRHFGVLTHKTNTDKLAGAKGIVIRSITPDTPGLVRVEDEDWRATSEDVLFEKDKIEVVGLSGVTLVVKKKV